MSTIRKETTLYATPSKDWVIPEKPKPGRTRKEDSTPLDNLSGISKKRVQSREAQRAFRERRQSQLSDLKVRLQQYEERDTARIVAFQELGKRLKEENEELRRSNRLLRLELDRLRQETPIQVECNDCDVNYNRSDSGEILLHRVGVLPEDDSLSILNADAHSASSSYLRPIPTRSFMSYPSPIPSPLILPADQAPTSWAVTQTNASAHEPLFTGCGPSVVPSSFQDDHFSVPRTAVTGCSDPSLAASMHSLPSDITDWSKYVPMEGQAWSSPLPCTPLQDGLFHPRPRR